MAPRLRLVKPVKVGPSAQQRETKASPAVETAVNPISPSEASAQPTETTYEHPPTTLEAVQMVLAPNEPNLSTETQAEQLYEDAILEAVDSLDNLFLSTEAGVIEELEPGEAVSLTEVSDEAIEAALTADKVIEFIVSLPPEKLEAIASVAEQISMAGNRLMVLYARGEHDSEEVVAIEELVAEWFDQLMGLGAPYDEQFVHFFLESLHNSETAIITENNAEPDDGMHELKPTFDFMAMLQRLSDETRRRLRSLRVASFMLQQLAA